MDRWLACNCENAVRRVVSLAKAPRAPRSERIGEGFLLFFLGVLGDRREILLRTIGGATRRESIRMLGEAVDDSGYPVLHEGLAEIEQVPKPLVCKT
jgi:hypothetical protein